MQLVGLYPHEGLKFDLPTGGTQMILGRAPTCDIVIPDPRVSSRHALIIGRDERWMVTDLSSRNGVRVNGVAIAPEAPVSIKPGDVVHLGSVGLRLGGPETRLGSRHTLMDATPTFTPRVVDTRLEMTPAMVDQLGEIATARTEEELAERIVGAAVTVTGYLRAAVLEPDSLQMEAVRVLAAKSKNAENLTEFSRSLLRQASENGLAVVEGMDSMPSSSLIAMGVREACCARLTVGEETVGLLYADSRGQEVGAAHPRHAFMRVLASVGSLAWANIRRAELASRQVALQSELQAARQMQERLMPPGGGVVGGCTYAVVSRPGAVVAGDMVDIFALPDTRVVMLLGDVMGKGSPAAMLMATLQARAREALVAGMEAGQLLSGLNRDVCERFSPMIVSLWLGVWDPRSGVLACADAGHGYATLTQPEGEPASLACAGGPVLGADPDVKFEMGAVRAVPGARLVLYSDGVAEQRGREGGQFGVPGVLTALRAGQSPEQDAEGLLKALVEHAGGMSFADDVTILGVKLG